MEKLPVSKQFSRHFDHSEASRSLYTADNAAGASVWTWKGRGQIGLRLFALILSTRRFRALSLAAHEH